MVSWGPVDLWSHSLIPAVGPSARFLHINECLLHLCSCQTSSHNTYSAYLYQGKRSVFQSIQGLLCMWWLMWCVLCQPARAKGGWNWGEIPSRYFERDIKQTLMWTAHFVSGFLKIYVISFSLVPTFVIFGKMFVYLYPNALILYFPFSIKMYLCVSCVFSTFLQKQINTTSSIWFYLKKKSH